MPMELVCKLASGKNFAKPKLSTRAVISSSRRILLGVRSQWQLKVDNHGANSFMHILQ